VVIDGIASFMPMQKRLLADAEAALSGHGVHAMREF
jgi:hypothetical protein